MSLRARCVLVSTCLRVQFMPGCTGAMPALSHGVALWGRFRGVWKMVKIGYGSNKKTRHMMPDGLYKMVVNNVKELEVLLMLNRKYAAEVSVACAGGGLGQWVVRWIQFACLGLVVRGEWLTLCVQLPQRGRQRRMVYPWHPDTP